MVCWKVLPLAFALLAFAGNAQTLIDLRTQGKSVDFTASPYTKPIQSGAALPTECSTGQMFLNLSAPAGANIYACTAANNWVLQGGGTASSIPWNSIGNPTANQSIAMGTNTTSWTFGNGAGPMISWTFASATGANPMAVFTDSPSNTGIGALLSVHPAAGSSAFAFQATNASSDSGWKIDNAGDLLAIGNPSIVAGGSPSSYLNFGSNNQYMQLLRNGIQPQGPIVPGTGNYNMLTFTTNGGWSETGAYNQNWLYVNPAYAPSATSATNVNFVNVSGQLANSSATFNANQTALSITTTIGAGTATVVNSPARVAALSITPVVNVSTSSSSGYTGIFLNITEKSTAARVNANYLLRAQTGGKDRFTVNNKGATTVGVNTVPFTTTPVFDASLGDLQTITLSGNVTSSTLVNLQPGQRLVIQICQDTTGDHTFSWATNVHGGMTIGSSPNKCSVQNFVTFDGTNVYANSFGVINE